MSAILSSSSGITHRVFPANDTMMLLRFQFMFFDNELNIPCPRKLFLAGLAFSILPSDWFAFPPGKRKNTPAPKNFCTLLAINQDKLEKKEIFLTEEELAANSEVCGFLFAIALVEIEWWIVDNITDPSILASTSRPTLTELIRKNLDIDPKLDPKTLAEKLAPILSIINRQTYEQETVEDQIYIIQQNLRYVSAETPPTVLPFAKEILVLVQDNLHALPKLEQILSSPKLLQHKIPPKFRTQHEGMAAMKDMLFAYMKALGNSETNDYLSALRSSYPYLSHKASVEKLCKRCFLDETRGEHIYKSWWYKRFERGTICAIYDLAIEWEVVDLLADNDGWDLSQKDACKALYGICLEKYPSYPFNGAHAERMVFELHFYRNRHKQEQPPPSEKSEASSQDSKSE